MLLSSNVTISLSKSKDYLRCAVFIYALAFIVLMRSGLPLSITIPLSLLLIIFLALTIYSNAPIQAYQLLTYRSGYWLLNKVDGLEVKYEQLTISFDGGLFILLTLTGINPQKKMVVFKDQLTLAQYRVLKLSST